MKTPAGHECQHFYGDYFRGKNVEECRLLKSQNQAWSPDLCRTCPVPAIARANSCGHMRLNAVVARPWTAFFQRRVQIQAFCDKAKQTVSEPQVGCGECHALPFTFEIKEE